jgi:filamentous hemagglutinin family protein
MKTAFRKFALFSGSLLCTLNLSAIPTKPTVVWGNVNIYQEGPDQIYITSSDKKVVIDWESFTVDKGERVHFLLPNASTKIINRVTTSTPTTILGSLISNNQLSLINPAGIEIGKEANIQAESFLAATLETDKESVTRSATLSLAAKDHPGVLLAQRGTITARSGDVTLVGQRVLQEGVIKAKKGAVTLGAGLQMTHLPSEIHKLKLTPLSASEPEGRGIDLGGRIKAIRVEAIADGALYQEAIHAGGKISAHGDTNYKSAVRLEVPNGNVVITGKITSSDNKTDNGGQIEILGKEIHINLNALLDASAGFGGGQIYIGGGAPHLWRADKTFIVESAVLDASALHKGDGGKIFIHATHMNEFWGQALSKGGAIEGNGGYIQITGEHHLNNFGNADVSAVSGVDGVVTTESKAE